MTDTPTTTAPDLIGKLVISWRGDGTNEYGGPSDYPGGYRLSYDMRHHGPTVLQCDLAHVAPADTTVPAKDPRIVVAQIPVGQYQYGQKWRLSLPDGSTDSFRTKRDAVAAGCRRLAITDWHAAQALAAHTA